MKNISLLDCPVCGKHTLEPFTNTITDINNWFCQTCGALYEDEKDKPATKLSETCPACGKEVHPVDHPDTGKFWKCKTCKLCLEDSDGKPVQPETCPSCGEKAYSRFEAQKNLNTFFWSCSACKHNSADYQ